MAIFFLQTRKPLLSPCRTHIPQSPGRCLCSAACYCHQLLPGKSEMKHCRTWPSLLLTVQPKHHSKLLVRITSSCIRQQPRHSIQWRLLPGNPARAVSP